MAISGATWRTHPFKIGQFYTAIQSFQGFPNSNFVAGQTYELTDIAYSHYDGCTIFTFNLVGNAEPCYWWWSDEEPESLCQLRFRVGT
jgi:hypothetical protein